MSEKTAIYMGRFPDSRNITYYIFEQNGIYTMEQIEGLLYRERERQYDGAFMQFNVKYSRLKDFYTKIKNDLKGWLPKYDIPYEIIAYREAYFVNKVITIMSKGGEYTWDEILEELCKTIKKESTASYVTIYDGYIDINITTDNPYIKIDKFFVGNDIFYRDLEDDAGFVIDVDLLYRQNVTKQEATRFVQENKKDFIGYVYTLIYRFFLKKKKQLDPEIIRFVKIDRISVVGGISHKLHILLVPKKNIKQFTE